MKEMTVGELILILQKCNPDAIVCECNHGGSNSYKHRAEGFRVRQKEIKDEMVWAPVGDAHFTRDRVYVELGQFHSHTENPADSCFDVTLETRS